MSKNHRRNAQKMQDGMGRYRLFAVDGCTHKRWIDEETRNESIKSGEIESNGGNEYRMKRKLIKLSDGRVVQEIYKDSPDASPTTLTAGDMLANAGLAISDKRIERAQIKVKEFGRLRSWAQGVTTVYVTRAELDAMASYTD